MDEDSQQLPESPRNAVATSPTPSPATPQPFTSSNSQPATPVTTPQIEAVSIQRSRTPTPQPTATDTTSPLGVITSVSSSSNATPVTTITSATPTAMPTTAGGSITTGIAAAAMQLPGESNATPSVLVPSTPTPSVDNSVAMPLIAASVQSTNDAIVQTPTKPDGQSKSKLLHLRELKSIANSNF